jgi:hypothetical protein
MSDAIDPPESTHLRSIAKIQRDERLNYPNAKRVREQELIEADDRWHALALERLTSTVDPMHAMQRQNAKEHTPPRNEARES